MKRVTVVVFLALAACRHGTPEKMSIKAARTSRFSQPWGATNPEPAAQTQP